MNRLYLLPVCALALACSSEDTKNDGGTDSGGTVDTGTGMDGSTQDTGVQDTGVQDTSTQDTGADTGVDAGFLLNGCTDNTFVNKINGNQSVRTIDPWNLTQTAPICIIIQKNQSVVWNASPNFNTVGGHPLGPGGGDAQNPITMTASGTTVTFAFPNTGNYGFHCQNHPGSMQGVIRVVN